MQDDSRPPPVNANEWSDEQWIDWLKATDATEGSPDETVPATKAGRITHSAGGQALGSAMIGLARVIYGSRREEPAIVVESGEPDDEGPFSLHLNFEQPDQSYIRLAKETDTEQ